MPGEKVSRCEEHGYYRGDFCPICNRPGKVLLYEDETESLGRLITGILRHNAEKYHLDMDPKGYVRIDMLSLEIRDSHPRKFHFVRPAHIVAIAKTDQKGRYQLSPDNKYIRATYGHSVEVDLTDLPTDSIPEKLYYPTNSEEFEIFKENGIMPADRRWVHLSGTEEKAYIAGLYHYDKPMLLEINTSKVLESGEKIYRAGDGVYITKYVPPNAFGEPKEFNGKIDTVTLEEIRKSKEIKQKRNFEGW
jgi:putative RNA 2'-phosphotransferase